MSSQCPLKDYITKYGLPHSPEHESAVLGVLLRDKTVMEMLTEAGIDGKYFHSPTMRDAYLACRELVDNDRDIDILSVKAYLKQNHSDENTLRTLIELSEIETLTYQIPTHI